MMKVKCINDSNRKDLFTEGKDYIVEDYISDDVDDFYTVTCDDGNTYPAPRKNFKTQQVMRDEKLNSIDSTL